MQTNRPVAFAGDSSRANTGAASAGDSGAQAPTICAAISNSITNGCYRLVPLGQVGPSQWLQLRWNFLECERVERS